MNHKKQDFYDHLDGKPVAKTDGETQALIEMLREVEDLSTPDPGADYWNQFNGAFQQRLAEQQRFSWRQHGFLGKVLPALASAALLVVAFFNVPYLREEGPSAEVPSLAELSPESLALLAQYYVPQNDAYLIVEDNVNSDLDAQDLVDSYEALYQEDSYNLQGLDAEQLESLWNLEG